MALATANFRRWSGSSAARSLKRSHRSITTCTARAPILFRCSALTLIKGERQRRSTVRWAEVRNGDIVWVLISAMRTGRSKPLLRGRAFFWARWTFVVKALVLRFHGLLARAGVGHWVLRSR